MWDGIEITIYYLLHFPNYLDERRSLLDNLQNIGENIHDKNDFQFSEFLLLVVSLNNDASDTCILNATIQYMLITKRFDDFYTNPWVAWMIHIFEYICWRYRLQQYITQDLITGCLYLFYYCCYYLYNELLNFLFCKCNSSHPACICSKLVLMPGALLFTLSISLNKFLLVEIPSTKHQT